jgi:hypothetical protein
MHTYLAQTHVQRKERLDTDSHPATPYTQLTKFSTTVLQVDELRDAGASELQRRRSPPSP